MKTGNTKEFESNFCGDRDSIDTIMHRQKCIDKKAGLHFCSPAKLVGGTPTLEAGTDRESRSASNKADHAQEIRLRIIALCFFAQVVRTP